jgi:long-chain acyl-CoA synthetase
MHFNRELKVYKERPKSLFEVLQRTAEIYPDKEALIYEKTRLTYKDFVEKTSDLAGNLQRSYQVKKGDRIALLVGNSIEFCMLVFAIAKIGAIIVPLNTKLKQKELEYMLTQCSARILILDGEFINIIEKVRDGGKLSDVQYYFQIGNAESKRKDYLPFELLEQSSTPMNVDINENDPLFIMYTSGTTGLPKGAVGNHLGAIHSAMNYERTFKTTSTTKTLITVPLFHVTGLIGQFIHMVIVGGTSVIMRKYKTPLFIEHILDEQVSFLFNVPAIYVMMMDHSTFANYSYPFVTCIAYGGAPLPSEVFYQLRRHFPNANLHNAYGATETHSPTTLMPQIYPDEKVMSVGLPVPVADIKIVDEQGQPCSTGQVGELLIKGPMVIEGYWNNPAENQKSFIDGYWCSGDLAMVDTQGFVYIMDRKKDMINRGGEKIYSIEIENMLYEHPSILEAAVVGIPDKIFGEAVKAVIVPKQNASITADEIKQFIADRLAKYKVPSVVEFKDELPRNPGGKILKQIIK